MISPPSLAEVEIRVGEVAARWKPGSVVSKVIALEGGASSLTYRAELALAEETTPIVIKMAPPGLEPVRNRDVLRQARVMEAIGGLGTVPVPDVIFDDLGAPPEVPPLFAMSWINGDSVEPLFDDHLTPRVGEADLTVRAHHCASALAALQLTDVSDAAFTDEKVWSPTDEVARWTRALKTVDPVLAPGWERCDDVLSRNVPDPMPPVVAHGDYRLGNMLSQGRQVNAIIDWELWGIGDPRFDLSWLRFNADPANYSWDRPYATAMPTPDDLLATYVAARGVDVADMAWFDALARYKSVSTWCLILKRDPDRTSPFAKATRDLPPMVERILELVG